MNQDAQEEDGTTIDAASSDAITCFITEIQSL